MESSIGAGPTGTEDAGGNAIDDSPEVGGGDGSGAGSGAGADVVGAALVRVGAGSGVGDDDDDDDDVEPDQHEDEDEPQEAELERDEQETDDADRMQSISGFSNTIVDVLGWTAALLMLILVADATFASSLADSPERGPKGVDEATVLTDVSSVLRATLRGAGERNVNRFSASRNASSAAVLVLLPVAVFLIIMRSRPAGTSISAGFGLGFGSLLNPTRNVPVGACTAAAFASNRSGGRSTVRPAAPSNLFPRLIVAEAADTSTLKRSSSDLSITGAEEYRVARDLVWCCRRSSSAFVSGGNSVHVF